MANHASQLVKLIIFIIHLMSQSWTKVLSWSKYTKAEINEEYFLTDATKLINNINHHRRIREYIPFFAYAGVAVYRKMNTIFLFTWRVTWYSLVVVNTVYYFQTYAYFLGYFDNYGMILGMSKQRFFVFQVFP